MKCKVYTLFVADFKNNLLILLNSESFDEFDFTISFNMFPLIHPSLNIRFCEMECIQIC